MYKPEEVYVRTFLNEDGLKSAWVKDGQDGEPAYKFYEDGTFKGPLYTERVLPADFAEDGRDENDLCLKDRYTEKNSVISLEYHLRPTYSCLLHDGSEAYMSDVIRPLKSMMSYYLEAEDRLQNMIWEKFIGHIPDEHERELIFEIDDQMLSLEFKELMAEALNDEYKKLKCAVDISYRPQADIRAEFIRLFEEVSKDA